MDDKNQTVAEVFLNKHWPLLEKMVFIIGGVWGKTTWITIDINHRTGWVTGYKQMVPVHYPSPTFDIEKEPVLLCGSKAMLKSEFFHRLRALEIEKWKAYYQGFMVDGEFWNVNLFFQDSKIPLVKSGGHNGYPANFDKFSALIGNENIAGFEAMKGLNDKYERESGSLQRLKR